MAMVVVDPERVELALAAAAREARRMAANLEALEATREALATALRREAPPVRRAHARIGVLAAPDEGPLTPRQLDILRRIAAGRSTDAIASECWLTRTTVRNHVAAILRRLDAHSRVEAVARGRELGLL
jgi:DNA-binding NarL/FixJ family response regulator